MAIPMLRVASAGGANRLAASRLPAQFAAPFTRPPVLMTGGSGVSDFHSIVMTPTTVEIAPGLATPTWAYNGVSPGPTIITRRGRPAVIRQANQLPSSHPQLGYEPWTSVHLHGSESLPQYDGYASDITRPGQYKDYRYPNTQQARTMWYHDHGVMHTGPNVYMGLAGQYWVLDDLEQSLPIPHGRYDVPLIVQDVMLASDGTRLWPNVEEDDSGAYGDIILVNGQPWPTMQVERRKYRFRILNASVSRSYRWQLDSGEPFTIIATDGGLMPAPQTVRQFRHGVAERYEVVIDFAKYPIGRRVILQNLSTKNNLDFATTKVAMAFDVTSESTSSANNAVPSILNPNDVTMALPQARSTVTRRFNLFRDNGQWTINGKTWEHVVKSGFKSILANPQPGTVETWVISNVSGGWHHPFHIHLIDFRVLSRNGAPALPHERGPKDVVFVGENETVRLLMEFMPHHRGKYMMHCHNLVHEDHDMMGQFQVGSGGDDPITADPAVWS